MYHSINLLPLINSYYREGYEEEAAYMWPAKPHVAIYFESNNVQKR